MASTSLSTEGGQGANANQTEVTAFVQGLLNQMQGRFNTLSSNIIEKIDDMGSRIDELERGIAEIVDQASEKQVAADGGTPRKPT